MKYTNWALPFAVPTSQAFILTWQRRDNPPSNVFPVGHLTLLLNFTAELVGWYRISLQGLLRLYEKPLSMISAKNTTCRTGKFWGEGGSRVAWTTTLWRILRSLADTATSVLALLLLADSALLVNVWPILEPRKCLCKIGLVLRVMAGVE